MQVDKSKIESSIFVQCLCYSSTDVMKNRLPYGENKPGLYSTEYAQFKKIGYARTALYPSINIKIKIYFGLYTKTDATRYSDKQKTNLQLICVSRYTVKLFVAGIMLHHQSGHGGTGICFLQILYFYLFINYVIYFIFHLPFYLIFINLAIQELP